MQIKKKKILISDIENFTLLVISDLIESGTSWISKLYSLSASKNFDNWKLSPRMFYFEGIAFKKILESGNSFYHKPKTETKEAILLLPNLKLLHSHNI